MKIPYVHAVFLRFWRAIDMNPDDHNSLIINLD